MSVPLIGLLLLLGFAGDLAAEPKDDVVRLGYLAYQDHQYLRAKALWTPAAEKGNLRAEFFLSVLYERGLGVARDDARALTLLRSAAAGGLPEAQFNLGNRYLTGQGVTRDAKQAAEWWKRAARKGFARAQFNLGLLYSLGKGVEVDPQQSIYWHRRAAANGSERALETLKRLGVDPALPDPLTELAAGGVVVSSSARVLEPSRRDVVSIGQTALAVQGESQPPEQVGLVETPATLGKGWIDRQPDDYYTIQLFSTSKLARAQAFQAKLSLPWPSAIFRYHVDGAIRIAVITGSFPDHNTARQAIQRLDSNLARNGPWVRSFAAVRQIRLAD